jgi:DNA-binding response OmpR family regulator
VAQVLLVEDDPTLRGALQRGLGERGHAVDAAPTALEALARVVAGRPDLVVLDLGLPDIDGTTVLRMLRGATRVPVIVATPRDDDAEIVTVLDAGADDYLVKPFGAAELDARIRAVLRRGALSEPKPAVVVGGLRVDPRARRVHLDGVELELSPREFALLHHLAVRADEVVGKRELLREVWRQPHGTEKTVDVHLSWLRRKLGETAEQPRYLHAVRGVGVRLSAPGG